jgi:hypothetical protein
MTFILCQHLPPFSLACGCKISILEETNQSIYPSTRIPFILTMEMPQPHLSNQTNGHHCQTRKWHKASVIEVQDKI